MQHFALCHRFFYAVGASGFNFAALRLQRYNKKITYTNKSYDLLQNTSNYLHISKFCCIFAQNLEQKLKPIENYESTMDEFGR